MNPVAPSLPLAKPRVGIFVAHPGHELRILHWLEQHEMHYGCLTDGSGGSARSRLGSTKRLVQSLGGVCGPILGRFTDKDVYRCLLERRVDVFVRCTQELAALWAEAGVDHVVGDAVEGFNPAHDVCRFMIDGAAALLARRTGRSIRNDDFVLDSAPDSCPADLQRAAHWLHLDSAAIERKKAAALAYEELRGEVAAALDRYGPALLALECLRPATTHRMLAQFESEAPAYERTGQMRVRQGVYRDIIRYRPHVLPVWQAIESAVRYEAAA